jgi:thiamine pyrophosphate-dependent acetolactate synthase large subunit-like protein
MLDLEKALLALTIVGLVLGAWGIVWVRTSRASGRVSWGRRLFVGTLVVLGAASGVAAFHQADGLIPLGLSSGFLVVGMLWEAPAVIPRELDASAQPENT